MENGKLRSKNSVSISQGKGSGEKIACRSEVSRSGEAPEFWMGSARPRQQFLFGFTPSHSPKSFTHAARSLVVCFSVALMVPISPSCVASGQPAGLSISPHSPRMAGRWSTKIEENDIRYVDPASRLNDMFIRKVSGPGPVMCEPLLVQTMGEGDPAQQKSPRSKSGGTR